MTPNRLALAAALTLATPLAAEPISVVADIPPVAALVAAVQDGRGNVTSIVQGGSDPHHMALRPSQARAVADADLAIWIGPELTPWFGEALDRLAPDAPALALLDHAPNRLPRREADHDHDDHDDHDHDDHEGHDHVGNIDPHAWLDPANALAWLDLIETTLARADPDGAEAYRANAAAERAEIEATIAELTAATRDRPGFAYLVDHDSLHYAEALAGARFAGALSDSHATAPGAAHLSRLERHLDEADVACLVTTGTENARLAARVAADHDLPLVAVDTLNAKGDYAHWLREMYSDLADCATTP